MLSTGTYFHKQLGSRMGLGILFAIVTVYIALLLQVQYNYLPVWNDEFFYYTNANSFFQNNTLKAALTYNGSGSRLVGADAHGFAYPLLNGGIAKVFGWHNLNFIYTNFFFVVAALILVFFQKKITSSNKFFIVSFVLLFPFFTIYGFTYMQESVHVFLAITCSFLIGRIHKEGRMKDYGYFILLIFIAALFRPFWLIWLVGLLPFAANKFQRRLFFLFFLFGGLLSLLLMYCFSESVPNYFASVVALIGKGDFSAFFYSMIRHFTYNGYAWFFKNDSSLVYFFVKCSILAVLIFFIVKAYLHRSKIFTSIAVIGIVNFLVLFLLYDVFMWRETRVLVSFFYFCIPFLVLEINYKYRFLVLFILIIFFALTLPESKKIIAERNMHSKEAIAEAKNTFGAIAPKLRDNAIVFVNYYPSDSTLDLISLPLKNISNSPVKYIVPYYRVNHVQYNYILNLRGTKPIGTVLIANYYFQLEEIK